MSNKLQTPVISINALPQDFIEAKNRIYDPCGMECSQPIMEKESAEYGACTFKLNNFSVRFGVSKITPTKIGQFVTLWKRIGNSPIQPYDISDPFDFFIISTRKDDYFGQFIFPKSVLCKQAVLSVGEEGGKRAIRVYPPWDIALNRQAQKTQKWQLEYFLEVSQDKEIDRARVKMLYSSKV
ncbi:MAG: MepB domain containing protein [Gammaproteobacteria bacterium]|jgi:hypothetical protein|nr:MepB domain containing protein [Gammaproteobacteria bacterium]